eukprot:CAMPEP_0184679194 /NCGR_PEP_ID=MMETSP0312-20130426/2023_1 /TAXON_ID=31354 /ORGANISM="Compsopogon coeruleus, Strain SAG 36.94" /LENGTH=168 /DNA_ID=CAMNT_0027128485 /DNA_START=183 /DNA_END=686 /DNA_ORIENTATION=+
MTILQTRVMKSTSRARWDEELKFPISHPSMLRGSIAAEVWDKDFRRDDLIGTVELSLQEFCLGSPMAFSSHWHELRSKAGKITGELLLDVSFKARDRFHQGFLSGAIHYGACHGVPLGPTMPSVYYQQPASSQLPGYPIGHQKIPQAEYPIYYGVPQVLANPVVTREW